MTAQNDKYPIERLGRDEFAAAVKKGLGRAFLHVKGYGLDDVADLVLEACLHDQAYDPQSESTRAPWLFDMFWNSPRRQEFKKAILAALKRRRATWDLLQLFELAREMAMRGDEDARRGIAERARENASVQSIDDWMGAEEWLETGGTGAAIELARIYGRRVIADPDDLPPEEDVFHTIQRSEAFKPEMFKLVLQDQGNDPAIKAYQDYLKARKAARKSWDRDSFRKEYTLERILRDAKNGIGNIGAAYIGFGREATAEELEAVYAHLLAATSNAERLRLMWVFRRLSPLPRMNDVFVQWANGKHGELRAATIYSLSQISDKRIHDLARSKAETGNLLGPDGDALSLFIKNYEKEDAPLICRALRSLRPDVHDGHTLGHSVADIAEKQKDPGLDDALLWAYESTPCTFNRREVVTELDAVNKLGGSLLHECLFDSNEDIRELARSKMSAG